MLSTKVFARLTLGGLLVLLFPSLKLYASSVSPELNSFTVHNLWILLATALVFIMHLGFASLEAGLTQAKNSANILFKNVSIVSLGILTYALIGFDLMYPGEEFAGALFGFGGVGLDAALHATGSTYNASYTYLSDFIFQAMFAATCATIVSGAVAERMKLSMFLIFASLLVAFCYPILGMWKWGGGFLDALKIPFYDFAGSTIVHSVGGWAALIAAIILGPRVGRFRKGHKIPYIQNSNLPLATLGVFLLWFGWFGFNGGSVLSAEPLALSWVFVTTALGGAAGILGSMLTAGILLKRADLSMTINGALAGLVAITAGADVFGFIDAVSVGFIGGILVVFASQILESLGIDDPVGAVPVHLVCGIWGTLAVGIFGKLASFGQFQSQLIGVVCYALGAGLFSFLTLGALNWLFGLRVSRKHEWLGLDSTEHGISSYSLMNR